MIPWYDNIPLVSFVILGGRCRYCRRPISLRYPAVELLTALLFFYFIGKMGLNLAGVKFCVFSAIMVALTFCDFEKRLLPDEFTLGGLAVGLIFAWFVPVPSAGAPDSTAQIFLWLAGLNVNGRPLWFAEALFGAAALSGILWAAGAIYLKLRGREGLGFGDVKLVAALGAFLGFRLALGSMAWGGIAGSVVGLAYIKTTHQDAATFELPYGTFLSLAALVMAAVGT
jgi:leader peptidase (prepilin peptidase)/N-methyltransferase